MNKSILSAIMIIVLAACADPQTRSAAATISESFDGITIESPQGTITVRSTTQGSVSVSARMTGSDSRLAHKLDADNILTLAVRCGADPCSGDLTVEIPTGVYDTLRATTSSGTIEVTGQQVSSTTLDTGKGNILFHRMEAHDAVLRTGAGTIRGSDLAVTTMTAINAGTGDISLAYAVAPTTVDLYTPDGNIVLAVPGAAYRVDAESTAGEVSISGITVQQDAKRHITCHTGSGSVSIEAR